VKKAYIHTFGCKVNQFDSQVIREHFGAQGYEFSSKPDGAELVIVNSCTVTAEADRQCRSLVRKIIAADPRTRVLLAGCYARRAGPDLVSEFPRIELFDAPSLRERPIASFAEHSRAFLKVQDGCDAFCSYCVVPFVRPVLWSRPVGDVLDQVRALVAGGYPEIVLTGVHLGKYHGGLEAVVRAIVEIPGEFRIRLSSLEINEVSDGLVELMHAHPARICRHLHVPLQSGSTSVLKRMKRPYTAESFSRAIRKIRASLPDVGISADVIVGFPGETGEEYDETRACIEQNQFSKLHVFRYSPRPGTAAAAMRPLVAPEVIKQRAQALREAGDALEKRFWQRFIGTKRHVVVEGTNNTALTDNYIRVMVDNKTISQFSGIFELYLTQKNGQCWGETER
jgi:threonylcarbamoyladenosine tRNA methylthiotransferase MtaB